jgi:Ca-activated chloride channel family protein
MGNLMFTFQWPFLALLMVIPFLIRYALPAQVVSSEASGAMRVPEIRFPHLSVLQNAYGQEPLGNQNKKSRWGWLLYLVWAFLIVALMRPQIVDRITSTNGDGRDLMLAVDLSGSMQSLDFATGSERVSRLDVAKKVVKDFVAKRGGDRVGLIVFGEHAYLQSPLTLDHAVVSKMLDNNLPGMAGDATSIGDAIGLAVKNLRDRPAQSRAIILLTDGEDNASTLPPLQAAELAKQYGIHIYTIVIGRDGEVPFPDGNGGLAMVDSHVDTALTRKIAEMTGGQFYRATDAGALAQIYNEIDALQKSKSDLPPLLIRKPLFQYPLGIALSLLVFFGGIVFFKGESYELVTL